MKIFKNTFLSCVLLTFFLAASQGGLTTSQPVGGKANSVKQVMSATAQRPDIATDVPAQQSRNAKQPALPPLDDISISSEIPGGEDSLKKTLAQSNLPVKNMIQMLTDGMTMGMKKKTERLQDLVATRLTHTFKSYREAATDFSDAMAKTLIQSNIYQDIQTMKDTFADGMEKIAKSGLAARQGVLKAAKQAFEDTIITQALKDDSVDVISDTELERTLLDIAFGPTKRID